MIGSPRGSRKTTRTYATLAALLVWGAIGARAPAQDGPDVAALLKDIRSGNWTAKNTKSLVEGLIDGKHLMAADWWITHAEDAIGQKKLKRSAKGTLSSLRRQWKKAAVATPEQRTLTDEVVKQLDRIGKLRNYAQARRLEPVAESLVAWFPDRRCERLLGLSKKLLARKKDAPDGNPKVLEEHRKACDELTAKAEGVIAERMKRANEEYRFAGCAPGRRELEARILVGHETRMDAEPELRRLYKLARTIEPTQKLQLWIVGASSMTVYRQEGPSAVNGRSARFDTGSFTSVSLRVFPGDFIRLVPQGGREGKKEEYDDGTPKNSLYVVQAQLDGQDLSRRAWGSIRKKDLDKGKPKQYPMMIGKLVPYENRGNNPVPNPKPKKQIEFTPPNSDQRFVYDLTVGLEATVQKFKDKKLKRLWITSTAVDAVYTITVPRR
ncbi:MAG: hypothetical protein CMJ83_17515 [Planctomycetes bacterium]|nr:hypothetical protein [Planctomycetota bacterium]